MEVELEPNSVVNQLIVQSTQNNLYMQRTQVTQLIWRFQGSVLSIVDYSNVYRWCMKLKDDPRGIVQSN